jgi:glycerophosphoryl diester phosphodiesterase
MRSFIIAHRGASFHAPENTLAAFRAAADLGADGIETDVQLTGDGKLVIHHNYTIDGCPVRGGVISRMTLAELKSCDIGSYRGAEWAGEQIPTLNEFLDCVKEFALIDIELKAPYDNSAPFVAPVVEEIRQRGLTDRVVISAFDHNLLRQAKSICPEIKVGALVMPTDFSQSRILSFLTACLPKERKLIEVTREDLLGVPDDEIRTMDLGIRSADALGAIVELAHQIGAVYPQFMIEETMEALKTQADIVAYIAGLDFRADYLHCHYSSVLRDPALVARLAQIGVGCNLWTPDDRMELEQLSLTGCNAIITNRPDILLEIQSKQNPEML